MADGALCPEEIVPLGLAPVRRRPPHASEHPAERVTHREANELADNRVTWPRLGQGDWLVGEKARAAVFIAAIHLHVRIWLTRGRLNAAAAATAAHAAHPHAHRPICNISPVAAANEHVCRRLPKADGVVCGAGDESEPAVACTEGPHGGAVTAQLVQSLAGECAPEQKAAEGGWVVSGCVGW